MQLEFVLRMTRICQNCQPELSQESSAVLAGFESIYKLSGYNNTHDVCCMLVFCLGALH